MLELLVKYAQDNSLVTEPGFAPKDVRWAIVLDEDGRFLDIVELGDPDLKRNPGQRFNRCPDLSQPEMVKKDGIKSHFLVETTGAIALYGKSADAQKTQERHLFFRFFCINCG